ncbi:WXG100 family type VII secretion target [Amycolatopsis vastitatis]|jgi:hypothetical protein|uniref:WXG100 family type VII secretion target n=1 Tax=Amycolatopsis vastitatis TaxID=1905142 RepID=A0A229TJB9_9PSEU|nr:hypothetical protein [Amycolatopsis vastitatis]OXM71100.1 hypothetical protein CF165_02750 [Amycolatopsis vastitatis]
MPDGTGFTAEPDAVLRASNGLVTAADGLENALKALQGALDAQGECWGNDDSGKEFAKDYVPGAQGATEGFANLVQGLRGMQQNVAKSMKALSGADEDVTSQLSKGQ